MTVATSTTTVVNRRHTHRRTTASQYPNADSIIKEVQDRRLQLDRRTAPRSAYYAQKLKELLNSVYVILAFALIMTYSIDRPKSSLNPRFAYASSNNAQAPYSWNGFHKVALKR